MNQNQDSKTYLLAASGISLVLSFIPFAGLLVYPFKLFVTFIHEGGHALATLGTLGSVEGIAIHPDTSGVTLSLGGMPIIISVLRSVQMPERAFQIRDGKRVVAITAALGNPAQPFP